MAWKEVGIALAEFVGGLVILRIGMPMQNILLITVAAALTVLGLLGMTRILSRPQDQVHGPFKPGAPES